MVQEQLSSLLEFWTHRPLFREFDGIVEEVEQDLLQPLCISQEVRRHVIGYVVSNLHNSSLHRCAMADLPLVGRASTLMQNTRQTTEHDSLVATMGDSYL